MTKRQIKRQYINETITMEEAIWLLMCEHDMFRGEALDYVMK